MIALDLTDAPHARASKSSPVNSRELQKHVCEAIATRFPTRNVEHIPARVVEAERCESA